MHGHIWGSLLAAPLLNNNHLPFQSPLIVSNSLWQIVADKPPAPPPSVTPAHSPYLYRLSFLIFDFAFKVMCFSPVMKSVFNRNTKWISLPLSPGFFFGSGSLFSCSFFLHWLSLSVWFSVGLRQWGEGGLNAMWGGIVEMFFFSLSDEVHLGAWSGVLYKSWWIGWSHGHAFHLLMWKRVWSTANILFNNYSPMASGS